MLLLGADEGPALLCALVAAEEEVFEEALLFDDDGPDTAPLGRLVGALVFPAPPPAADVPEGVRGDPFFGIFPTTLSGSRTKDSVPEGLGAVPSRFVPAPEVVFERESVRLWPGVAAVAGDSLISSLSLPRRLAASQADFAAGDAFSLARRCVGVKAFVLKESFL